MKEFIKNFKGDLFSSLVVCMVAIPLSVGLAIASGASPAAGLIAAIVGGVIVGSFTTAPMVVSGAANCLTVLIFQVITDHGATGLMITGVLAGLMQITLGLLKAGSLVSLMPKPAIEGVLSAVGVIIIAGQLHILTGNSVPSSPYVALMSLGEAIKSVTLDYEHIVAPVFALGLLGIFIQIFWEKLGKQKTFFKNVPGALPSVLIITLLGLFWELPRVQVAELIPTAQLSLKSLFQLDWTASLMTFLPLAVVLTLMASTESLVTAKSVDVLAKEKLGLPPSKPNHELVVQGAGNVISCALGGLPLTGAIVRSAANMNAGAKSRMSTIFHGVWILLLVTIFPFILTSIPLTALAAVLVVTGYKLLKLPELYATLKTSPEHGIIWLGTIGAILLTNLMYGLLISIIAYMIYRFVSKLSWASMARWISPALVGLTMCALTFLVSGMKGL